MDCFFRTSFFFPSFIAVLRSDLFTPIQDMSFIEVTYQTTEQHETLLDLVHECFHHDNHSAQQRSGPWCPHVSLVYDNPERPISQVYLEGLVQRYPSLQKGRRLNAISLWKTKGTIDQWKLLERRSLERAHDD